MDMSIMQEKIKQFIESIKNETLEKRTLYTDSYEAGLLAAQKGTNINNSYPFNHECFVKGYKLLRPESKTLLEECSSPEQRLKMLEIMRLTEIG